MFAEGRFSASGGEDYYRCSWTTADAGCNVVIIHGYREHCLRYEHVAAFLNAGGYNVFTYDQLGHGKSPGKKAYIERFGLLVDDLESYLEYLTPELQGKPTFVIAHSMGGLVFTRFLETRAWRPRAAVFSSPFLQVQEVSPVLLAVAGVLSRWTPWLPVAGLDAKSISRDPAVVRQYENDPLNGHGPIVARSGAEITAAVAQARAEMGKITLPLYIIHGKDDRLAPCGASQYLYDHAASADKTLRLYDDGYHELFNDLEKDTVLRGVRDWIDSRR